MSIPTAFNGIIPNDILGEIHFIQFQLLLHSHDEPNLCFYFSPFDGTWHAEANLPTTLKH